MINLRILLGMILLGISMGAFALFFTNETNNLFGIALAVIYLLVAVTVTVYLLIDLYSSMQDEH